MVDPTLTLFAEPGAMLVKCLSLDICPAEPASLLSRFKGLVLLRFMALIKVREVSRHTIRYHICVSRKRYKVSHHRGVFSSSRAQVARQTDSKCGIV